MLASLPRLSFRLPLSWSERAPDPCRAIDMFLINVDRLTGEARAESRSCVRFRVQEPLAGRYDLVLRAANDNVDEAEHYIRTYLAPQRTATPVTPSPASDSRT